MNQEEILKLFNQSLPTRIDSINFSDFQGVQVWMKRDDLIDSVVSGNKWRKLKYHILHSFGTSQPKQILTFGGAYSNHVPAVAKVCNLLGIPAIGCIRGDELHASSNNHLKYCSSQGMKLMFLNRDEYRNKKQYIQKSKIDVEETYIIDEGGRSELGAMGCGDIVDEITEHYDHILVSVGTGTTLTGIASKLYHKFPKTQLHGILVLKAGKEFETEINQIFSHHSPYILHTKFHQGGYAKTNQELDRFIEKFIIDTGIKIEFVYTGKMLWALKEFIQTGYIKPYEKVLLIHTGGFGL